LRVWRSPRAEAGPGRRRRGRARRRRRRRPAKNRGTILRRRFRERRHPDGDILSFSVSNLPAWAQFDDTTGRLSGTPRQPDIGHHAAITISVSDGELDTALAAFSILVEEDENDAVAGSTTLKWKAPKRNVDGSKLEDLAGYRVYYGQDPANLFNRVEIPERQITRATMDDLSSGTWYFAVTAYTTAGLESELSTIVSKKIG
jgi:hypothetical protein